MYGCPQKAYCFATRPKKQTLRLARVRVWLADPVTGNPTGRSVEDVVERLSRCSRIENYSITRVDPTADGGDGDYHGYYDWLDELALEHTPGRRPYKNDEDHEIFNGNFAPDGLEVRVAFKEHCHAPTVDYLRRLLNVRLRDIVFVNRRYLKKMPYAEQVFRWLDDLDTETDFDSRVTLKPVVDPAYEVPTSFAADGEDDPRMPTLVAGDAVISEQGRPPHVTGVDPYDLSWNELVTLTEGKETSSYGWFIDPRFLFDKTNRQTDKMGCPLFGSALVRQPALGHLGRIKVDYNPKTPRRTYIMRSGNGLVYQVIGRWARVLECCPDRRLFASLEKSANEGDVVAGLQIEIIRNTISGITTMPYPVLVGLYQWAFPTVVPMSVIPGTTAKELRDNLFVYMLDLLQTIYAEHNVDPHRYQLLRYYFDRETIDSLIASPELIDDQPLVAEQNTHYNLVSPEAFAESAKHIHQFPDYAYGICETPAEFAVITDKVRPKDDD